MQGTAQDYAKTILQAKEASNYVVQAYQPDGLQGIWRYRDFAVANASYLECVDAAHQFGLYTEVYLLRGDERGIYAQMGMYKTGPVDGFLVDQYGNLV